jgi:DNA-binding protein H-NS
MKGIDLERMPREELWTLHETVCAILTTKLEERKWALERRIDELGREFPKTSNQRRPYPKVHPKYRNPESPNETWSGRGKQPHWVRKLLASGKAIGDLRISNAK